MLQKETGLPTQAMASINIRDEQTVTFYDSDPVLNSVHVQP